MALLAELSSLRAELDHERAGRADAEGRAGAGAERVAALEQQLQVARKEVRGSSPPGDMFSLVCEGMYICIALQQPVCPAGRQV